MEEEPSEDDGFSLGMRLDFGEKSETTLVSKTSFKAPEGKKVRKVAALSPDTEGDRVNVSLFPTATVTLPEVTLWTGVVAEFK